MSDDTKHDAKPRAPSIKPDARPAFADDESRVEKAGAHPMGTTLGAVGGAATGAVAGIAAGPIGSVAGAVAGAIGGAALGSGNSGVTVNGPVDRRDEPGDGDAAGSRETDGADATRTVRTRSTDLAADSTDVTDGDATADRRAAPRVEE